MAKCDSCVFRGTFQDMGASCYVCRLHDDLISAIKACEMGDMCCYKLSLKDAREHFRKYVSNCGRWKGAGFGDYYCSVCNTHVSGNLYRFCPECGAKMN